jgi:hypothetical protein
MSAIIRKGNGDVTTDIEVANSNTYMIPAPARFCEISQTAAQSIPAQTWTLMQNLTTTRGENWLSGNCLKAPESGTYDITFRCLLDAGVASTGNQAVIKICNSHEGYTNNTCAVSTLGGEADKIMSTHCVICLAKDALLYFGISVSVTGRSTMLMSNSITMVSAVLLEQSTPYIVAYKGALVGSNEPGELSMDPGTGKAVINNLSIPKSNTNHYPKTWVEVQSTIPVRGQAYVYTFDELTVIITKLIANGWAELRVKFDQSMPLDWRDINYYDTSSLQVLAGRVTLAAGAELMIDNDCGYTYGNAAPNYHDITLIRRDASPQVWKIGFYPWGFASGTTDAAGEQGWTIRVDRF